MTLLFSFLFISIGMPAQTQWEKFTATADSLDLEMQFETSLVHRVKAVEAAKNEPDSIQKMLLGLQLFTQAEYDFSVTKGANADAYDLMQKAVDILQKANASAERISKAYWDLNLAAFNYMRNQQDTEKFLNKSIAYHLKSADVDTMFLLNTMHGSGYMALLSGNYEKSIETLGNGITLFDQYQVKKDKENDLKGYFYSNLALVHNSQFLNIPQKELQYLSEAEKVFAAMDDPDLEYLIGTYIDLSKAERGQRNYKGAEGYLNKAKRLYESHKEQFHTGAMHYVGFKSELDIYNNLIIIYRESGDKTKMLEVFSRVENLALNNKFDQTEQNQYAGILRSVGRYYIHQEYDFEQALKFIHKALGVNTERTAIHFGDKTRIGLHSDLANAYLLKRDYHQALKIIADIERQQHTPDSYNIELKAKALLGLHKRLAAVDAINQLLTAISEDNRDFQFSENAVEDFTPGYVITDAEGLVALAEAFRDYYEKYSKEEESLYWMALAQLESNMGTAPLNKSLKSTFDKIVSGLMNAALERGFSTKENNRLLTFIEVLSSQDLIHNFLLKREIAGNTPLYKLVEEEQYTRSYITYFKKEYQKSKDENIRQQLFEKELELKKINEQLAAQYRQSKLFVVPEVDITATTGKNIVKFKVTGNELFKTRLYNGKLTYQKIADYPVLKQEIENYLSHINNLEIPVSTIKEQGEILFGKLFTDDFNTTAPTVIIPDDILHYLPFELLVKNNAYLIENHIISYASNFYFSNTKIGTEGSTKRKKAVFFAPKYSGSLQESQFAVRGEPYALLGAEEEVNQIAKFIPGKVYDGNSASKSRFKSLESNLSILHLAMHSSLNNEDPELSNLLFSDAEDDYEMYISELYGLNFDADLAVLSACNTGVGGFKDGGNLVSMHHAFTTAGIPATIASLWNAPDQSTREIMVTFYKNLQQGRDKASALQQAKLNYLSTVQDENLQHPFYWAGFVLSGDESPVQLTEHPFWQQPSVIFILAMVALLIAAAVLLKRRAPMA